MVGSRRQGWAIFSAMAILFVIGVAVVYAAEQHGTPAQHLAGVSTDHFAGSTGGNLEGKEQRFGIANSALWTVGDHGHLDRRGQLRVRVAHRPRRRRAVRQPVDERGRLRRSRHRPVLDARLRPAGRLHRRPDGRPHAGVPGQEDRRAGDQAAHPRGAVHAAGGADVERDGGRHPGRARVDRRVRPPGLLGEPLRLPLPGQQQRLGLGRLHRATSSPTPATSAPRASRSPTCSAA